MRELQEFYNAMFYFELMAGALILAFFIFFGWCSYVYVISRRDWFEEDVKIRSAEKSYNLAKAEQIRLESLALKDRLEKNGIDTKQSFM
ncbi:hypothetical protein ABE957_08755 [Halomonas sp. CS7]|uniref:Uncharacterized protein n=1 Tax=Halomonas pelophila TaxID=3151122 RepID=A0ABV1N4W8_9GAMM